MHRRRALTVVGTVGLTGMAGCLGEEGFEYVAEPAAVPDAAARGYEADGPDELDIDETVEAAGIEQDIRIRTWSAAYTDDETETTLFLFSTPDVSIAGLSVNPLARLSGADLIARVIGEGLGSADVDGGIEDIEAEAEREASVLGEERTVQEFSAVFEAEGAQQAGEDGELPIRLYVLSFVHQEDVILAVGLQPDMAELAAQTDDVAVDADAEMADTTEELLSLMEAINHPVEPR